VALPDTFPAAKNLVTVQGRLLMDKEGIPFAGGVVLVKKDMAKLRPDFVSQRTDENGRYKLRLPADTPYFLLGRERSEVQILPPLPVVRQGIQRFSGSLFCFHV